MELLSVLFGLMMSTTSDGQIILAMKHFGPPPISKEFMVKPNKGAGGAPVTNYILLENGSDVLLDEDGNKLILE